MVMNITFISDTHMRHERLALSLSPITETEVLVHCGDYGNYGNFHEAAIFLEWFAKQPHQHKLLISGNHDGYSEEEEYIFKSIVPADVTYLRDTGVEIEGIKFWGSPVTPSFNEWYWNRKRGEQIAKHWSLVPPNIDILITHGPAHGILDTNNYTDGNVGCEDLLKRINEVRPLIHAFGHIHQVPQYKLVNETYHIVASCSERKPFFKVNLDTATRKVITY
jgi:Icc-related predicted phosphoesterase